MKKFKKWCTHQIYQWPIQKEYIEKVLMLKYLWEQIPCYCPKSWVGIKEDEFWNGVKKDVERLDGDHE